MFERSIDIKTPDGVCDARVWQPEPDGQWPGVVMLTDIMAPRPVYWGMAERMAGHGYVVLLPNIYYRDGKLPLFDHIPSTQNDDDRTKLRAFADRLSGDAMARDGGAYVDALAAMKSVNGKVGVVGYCLTGSMAVRVAAARPDTVKAAASFHGGRLATDAPDSPHTLLPKIKAELYFGHATDDTSCPAPMIEKLEAVLKDWGGKYESVVYSGGHGFAVYAARAYDQEASERHWKALTQLFHRALKEK